MSLIGELVGKLLHKGSITLLTPGQAAANLSGRAAATSHRAFHRPQGRLRHRAEPAPRPWRSLYGRPLHRRGRDDPRPPGADRRRQPLGGRGEGRRRSGRVSARCDQAAFQRNEPTRSRATSPTITTSVTSFTTRSSTRTSNIAAPISPIRQQPRTGAGRQESAYRRQARAEARPARARHRLRLGRNGALSAQGRRRRRPRRHFVGTAAEIARRRAEAAGVSDHVKFELIDYRKLEGEFDRIVSVGMFEHVGEAHYDEFFAKCRELLKPRRRDAAAHDRQARRAVKAPDPFTDKYIFPGYHLPSLSQMQRRASGRG